MQPIPCANGDRRLVRHLFPLTLALGLGSAQAAEIATDPGDYVPLPEGSNLGLLYLQHATRDNAYADGQRLPGDNRLDTSIGLARFVHYLDIGGYTINPQVILPFGEVELKSPFGPLQPGSASGAGDPILGATAWLLNAPEQHQWFGVSAFASIPVGQYDSSQGPVNIGENRWKGIFQAGYVTGLSDHFMLDLIGEYAVYGDNDDYLGTRLEQDDGQSLQAHLRYLISPRTHVALSYYHDFGGETTLGGAPQDDTLDNNRWLATFATFVQPTLQLQAQYGQDIETENGFAENHRFNLRLAKVF